MPGLGARLGRGGATTFLQDLAHSDCIVIMGANMAENHPVGFRFVVRAREQGATVIHVDPRFTRTSALADLHVPLRAGSDIVFLGALINHVIQHELYFEEYVRHYTNAATIVGHGADAFAVHVKGLELPGYEPRTLQAMALGLAVNARGADHNRSGAYEADLSGRFDRLSGGSPHAAAALDTEDRAAVMDSMILCKFLRGVFTEPWPEWAGLMSAVAGWDLTGEELHATAKRIVLAKRMFNLREGWTPADDTLPPRFLSESLEMASGRPASLSAETLRGMVTSYYGLRGLDADGQPSDEALADLHLEPVAV